MKKAFLYAGLAYFNGYMFIQYSNYLFMFAQVIFITLAFKEFFNARKT